MRETNKRRRSRWLLLPGASSYHPLSSAILQSLQFGSKTDILMNKNKLIIDTRQTLETRFHMFMCGRVKNSEADMCQHEIVTIAQLSRSAQSGPLSSTCYFLAIVNLVFSLQSTCCIWIMGMQEDEWSTQHSPSRAVLPMVPTFSVCLFSISSSTVDTSYRLSPFHLISPLTPSIHSMESREVTTLARNY